jgi:hypothetical protein
VLCAAGAIVVDSDDACAVGKFGVRESSSTAAQTGCRESLRDKPDFTALNFAQRFTGTFADDGTTIAATWETSPERAHWSTDFELTYTRIAHAGVSDNGACNPRTSETVCTPPLSEQRRMLHLDGR